LTIHPAAYTNEYLLSNNDLPAGKVEEIVIDVLRTICRELQGRGCRLIGHVKALLHSSAGVSRFFSVTSFDERVRSKGFMDSEALGLGLIVNVIVFGVDESDLRIVCEEVIGKTKIFAHKARV
jgi:hypothetical protein